MMTSPVEKDFLGSLGEKSSQISQYVVETFHPEDLLLNEVRKRAEAKAIPAIHVGRMDGLHLEVLTRAIGARNAVEIGTLAGYSGVCIARGMGPQGKLRTFEFEPLHAEVARETFKIAGVESQIEIYTGAALQQLPRINKLGPFDLVFIDADKVSYPSYLKWAADNLRVGGVVLADNTFAWGLIADEHIEDPEDATAAKALHEFNREIVGCGRFRATLLPTGEGLTMGVKIK